MERHGHLYLPGDVRAKLLGVSRSTVDRILSSEKERAGKSISTTKAGNLFKHQIQVRTFADWDDVIPDFLEADLVAHCGGNTNGAFLNTLTLTDITTGWTECLPLLRKSAGDVIIGLKIAQELLPFPLLGIDTDNGCRASLRAYQIFRVSYGCPKLLEYQKPYRKQQLTKLAEREGFDTLKPLKCLYIKGYSYSYLINPNEVRGS